MYTYHQLLSNQLCFKIYEMQHCGHYAGFVVFGSVTKNLCELEYKVQVVSCSVQSSIMQKGELIYILIDIYFLDCYSPF